MAVEIADALKDMVDCLYGDDETKQIQAVSWFGLLTDYCPHEETVRMAEKLAELGPENVTYVSAGNSEDDMWVIYEHRYDPSVWIWLDGHVMLYALHASRQDALVKLANIITRGEMTEKTLYIGNREKLNAGRTTTS